MERGTVFPYLNLKITYLIFKKDIWGAKLQLKIDNSTFIQYKYVIASNYPSNGEIKRWECGPNRILSLKNITKLEFALCI